jgi:hypothetical protein
MGYGQKTEDRSSASRVDKKSAYSSERPVFQPTSYPVDTIMFIQGVDAAVA